MASLSSHHNSISLTNHIMIVHRTKFYISVEYIMFDAKYWFADMWGMEVTGYKYGLQDLCTKIAKNDF